MYIIFLHRQNCHFKVFVIRLLKDNNWLAFFLRKGYLINPYLTILLRSLTVAVLILALYNESVLRTNSAINTVIAQNSHLWFTPLRFYPHGRDIQFRYEMLQQIKMIFTGLIISINWPVCSWWFKWILPCRL